MRIELTMDSLHCPTMVLKTTGTTRYHPPPSLILSNCNYIIRFYIASSCRFFLMWATIRRNNVSKKFTKMIEGVNVSIENFFSSIMKIMLNIL